MSGYDWFYSSWYLKNEATIFFPSHTPSYTEDKSETNELYTNKKNDNES